MARILVLGGSGQLGTALVRRLSASGEQLLAPARSELDLLAGGLAAAAASASAVINACAYNDVDGAELESNQTRAFGLNRDAPAELARACALNRIPFVHVSTDYVFDGRGRAPYDEDDPTGPLQAYGRGKLAGEQAVLEAYPRAVVVRTSTLYGADRRKGSNFVAAILRNAREKGALDVVEPPVSSPTYADDLAAGILALLEAGAKGVVHVANNGGCSRLELATEIVRLAGLADTVELRTRVAPTAGARRPAYSVLDTSYFTRLTGQLMRPWQQALADYVVREGGPAV